MLNVTTTVTIVLGVLGHVSEMFEDSYKVPRSILNLCTNDVAA